MSSNSHAAVFHGAVWCARRAGGLREMLSAMPLAEYNVQLYFEQRNNRIILHVTSSYQRCKVT